MMEKFFSHVFLKSTPIAVKAERKIEELNIVVQHHNAAYDRFVTVVAQTMDNSLAGLSRSMRGDDNVGN